jgi:hypothetical protein
MRCFLLLYLSFIKVENTDAIVLLPSLRTEVSFSLEMRKE